MRVLIVDSSAEYRESCARKIEVFAKADKEMLGLTIRLVSEKEVTQRLSEADVMIIGAGLSSKAVSVARSALKEAARLQIVMFVSDELYGGEAFRLAHSVGVRKVFPESASSLDLLQELVAIHSDVQKEGRTSKGRVVVVLHGKGGVGATSAAAAIGEVCSLSQRRTLLWDLDVETKDLSRCLAAAGPEARIVSEWVNGRRDITQETFRDAIIPIASDVSILTTPDRFAESMDLVCHADGMQIAQRIVELAKVLFDVVIIDTGGRMGPAVGRIIRNADIVLLVSDESELGLTAMDILLTSIKPLIGESDRLRFLIRACSDRPVNLRQISTGLESLHELSEACWSLPSVPFDPKVSSWPGSGNTLYSAGNKELNRIFKEVVAGLGVLLEGDSEDGKGGSVDVERIAKGARRGWLQRLFC